MNRTTALALLVMALAPLRSMKAQNEPVLDRLGSATLVKASGGSVRISHGMFIVSRNSSLELQWLMVRDSTMGVLFREPVGVKGIWDDPWYRYQSNMKVRAISDIAGFEVRLVTFNVWGQFTGTLSFTQLEDMKAGQEKDFERVWGIFGESHLREHFTSIAYIASVRFADGRTIVADPALVLKAAQAIKSTITLQDLEPRVEPIPMASSKS